MVPFTYLETTFIMQQFNTVTARTNRPKKTNKPKLQKIRKIQIQSYPGTALLLRYYQRYETRHQRMLQALRSCN